MSGVAIPLSPIRVATLAIECVAASVIQQGWDLTPEESPPTAICFSSVGEWLGGPLAADLRQGLSSEPVASDIAERSS